MKDLKSEKIEVGDTVVIEVGATKWMKERGFWLDEYPKSVDGMAGRVMNDFSGYEGDDSHYELELFALPSESEQRLGVHPSYLSKFDG